MRAAFLLLSIIVFFACEKDQELPASNASTFASTGLDTIYPRSYFPIYPGSWWITMQDDTFMTGDAYVEYGSYALPMYQNRLFMEYSTQQCGGAVSLFTPYLVEYEDSTWEVCEFANWESYRKVVTKDTALETMAGTFDSVIVVLSYGTPIASPYGTYEYYAKGAGLMFAETILPDTSYIEFEVVEYFIND